MRTAICWTVRYLSRQSAGINTSAGFHMLGSPSFSSRLAVWTPSILNYIRVGGIEYARAEGVKLAIQAPQKSPIRRLVGFVIILLESLQVGSRRSAESADGVRLAGGDAPYSRPGCSSFGSLERTPSPSIPEGL